MKVLDDSKNKDAKRFEEISIKRFGCISLNKDSKEEKLPAPFYG
jgi:hypothetical protein